jgi:phage tail tape-measure protein
MPAITGLDAALAAVQLLNAVAVAGGNILAATERVSLLLQQKHAKGETLTKEDLLGLMDEGDIVQAQEIARVRAALA